jgi:hypothetical protein
MHDTIPASESALAGDLLRGVKRIAEFLGSPDRSVLHMCSRGYIPAGKEGGRWVASKRQLRAHYDGITGGMGETDGDGAAV